MSVIKVGLPFLYSSMKKIPKDLAFDIEKWLWKSELCRFDILKQPKGKKYFHGRFLSPLA
jgi:hypothetical protein